MPSITLSGNEAFICEMEITNGPCEEMFLDHFMKNYIREKIPIYLHLKGQNPFAELMDGAIPFSIIALERFNGEWNFSGLLHLDGRVKQLKFIGGYDTHSRKGHVFVVATKEEAFEHRFDPTLIAKAFPKG